MKKLFWSSAIGAWVVLATGRWAYVYYDSYGTAMAITALLALAVTLISFSITPSFIVSKHLPLSKQIIMRGQFIPEEERLGHGIFLGVFMSGIFPLGIALFAAMAVVIFQVLFTSAVAVIAIVFIVVFGIVYAIAAAEDYGTSFLRASLCLMVEWATMGLGFYYILQPIVTLGIGVVGLALIWLTCFTKWPPRLSWAQ